MKFPVVFLLALPLALALAMPADWQALYDTGDLLFSTTQPKYLPVIGNGYMGTFFRSNALYVSGVFNGRLTTSPSHRARVPSPVNVSPLHVPSAPLVGIALDMRHGLILRRYENTSLGLHVEERFFTHRALQHVLVYQQVVRVQRTQQVCINTTTTPGPPSDDIHFQSVTNATVPSGNVQAMAGPINETEAPGGQVVTVATVASRLTSGVHCVTVEAGETKTMTWVTAVATSLEGGPPYPLARAAAAFSQALQLAGQGTLYSTHAQAWEQLLEENGNVEFASNLGLAQVVNASFYTMLSSIRHDRPFSLSPGSWSNAYNGHTFWDAETWMYPPLLTFFPSLAEAVINYRVDRMHGAHAKALSYHDSYNGLMFPWESAFTGLEVCPAGVGTGVREQHITGDIAFSLQQFWRMSGNATWLKLTGLPMAAGIAQFWATRVEANSDSSYSIRDVIGPDEYHDHVNDSVYTNTVAQLSLRFAAEVLHEFNQPVPANWSKIAAGLRMPFNASGQYHLEFDSYKGSQIKQADVVLLGFPLGANISETVRRNDLDYYAQRTNPQGPCMTWSMHAIGYAELGDLALAHKFFNQSYQPNVKMPFGVWTETPTGGTVNFITGSGGFLQAAIFGYSGMRIHADHLAFTQTAFPENTPAYTLRGVAYRGNRLSVRFDSDSGVTLQLHDQSSATPLQATLSQSGQALPLSTKPLQFPLQDFTIEPSTTL